MRSTTEFQYLRYNAETILIPCTYWALYTPRIKKYERKNEVIKKSFKCTVQPLAW
jgi:hypothetical protein